MKTTMNQLLNDEAGFIVSAELVLVATIAVLGLVVGLSELTLNINNELEDVGSAFARMQQSYHACGFNGHKGGTSSSKYYDQAEFCDCPGDIN